MWHRRKPLSRKKVSIKELSERYGVHRNTMSRRVSTIFNLVDIKTDNKQMGLYSFWDCVYLVNELDKQYRRGLWEPEKAINSQ